MNGIQQEKEKAVQDKIDEKARKEQEKEQRAQEKVDQQASKQRTKMWGAIASAVVVPLAKQLINSFFGGKKRR